MPDAPKAAHVLRFDIFELDVRAGELRKRGVKLRLRGQPLEVLASLLERAGDVVTRDELRTQIWPADTFVDFDHGLNNAVARIREALGDSAEKPRYVETLPRRGYRFVGRVHEVAPVLPAATTVPRIPITNLPTQRTSIVGRDQEIEHVFCELCGPSVRLLSLIGAGGVGKTTLARAVASRLLHEFADGVFFIDLTAIRQPELVASTIGQILGIEQAERNLTMLKERLRARKMLLILDNFEQVLPAGSLVAELLAAAPGLKVLVTSRVLLQRTGEREYIVPPLGAPETGADVSASELTGYGAVMLFVERARAVKPNFELTEENALSVARICARLDGLPLAIELAAARVKLLSTRAILSRLDHRLKLLTGGSPDLPTRQQTMSAAIGWSYELLSDEEKRLFRRLAVFEGGFTVEGAETILGGTEVLDGITSLVKQSLVVVREAVDTAEPRMQMLEVVREYAVDRLETCGEAETIRKAHAAYFLALAEQAEPQLHGPQPAEWVSRLDAEYDNLRAALRWSLANDRVTAARIAGAIRSFWVFRGYLTEGLGILKEILSATPDVGWAVLGKLLSAAGNISKFQGDYQTAHTMFEEGLRGAQQAQDLTQVSLFYRGLGGLALEENNRSAVHRFIEQALATAREANDRFGIARSLSMLGDLARSDGDDKAARPRLEEALRVCRQVGDKYATSVIVINLAAAEYGMRDFAAAETHFAEGLQMALECGDSVAGNRIAVTYALDGFAALATRGDEPETAAKLAAAAEGLRESMNHNIEATERHFRDAYMARLHSLLPNEKFLENYSAGRRLKLEESVALALCISRRMNNAVAGIREALTPEPLPCGRTADLNDVRALAVLPLEDLSGTPGYEYFADGMTEALITSLAKIKALRVISRTSAMQYRGVRKSLPQIARELNVDAVIEGSVLRSGERVRIAAQLIHAKSDQHLWAESYERDCRDILSLQGEIARQIAHEVQIILTPEERARLGNGRQVNPGAHELYLKARYHWNKRTDESVKKAIAYFHQALDCDPTYAQTHAGLADAYNILGYYNALPPKEAYPKGKVAALKAIELDNSLAEPHATLGVVKRDFEWDWPGAEEEFQRAIELNPGLAESYHWRGTLFSMQGLHPQGIREKTRALAIDPLSVVIRTDLARMFYFARHYDQSLEQYRAALDMDPNFGFARLWLAHVYQQKGLFEEAISELKMGLRQSNNSPYALAKLGHGYAVAGHGDEARAVLNQLKDISKQRYVSPYDIAIIHVGLGENNDAFVWLEQAFEHRSHWLGYLNVEPQLDAFRSDQRFQKLLRRVGLP